MIRSFNLNRKSFHMNSWAILCIALYIFNIIWGIFYFISKLSVMAAIVLSIAPRLFRSTFCAWRFMDSRFSCERSRSMIVSARLSSVATTVASAFSSSWYIFLKFLMLAPVMTGKGDGPVCSWLAMLSSLFCELAWQCLRLGLFLG